MSFGVMSMSHNVEICQIMVFHIFLNNVRIRK